MNKLFSIVAAPIQRGKALKLKQAQAGISDDTIMYNKLLLSEDLECVQEFGVAVNAALEALAAKLIEAGFETPIGEDQFATMVEKAKAFHACPIPVSCQSDAHKQNLIDNGTVPEELWALEQGAVSSAKTDLSEGLSIS